VRRVVVAGILGAVLASVLALIATSFGATTYRAEADLAVLPSSAVSPDQAPAFWEALSRGQVPRTAAEIFNQPRWLAAAARAVGSPSSSLTMTAGVVPDTTLVKVTLAADSRSAAERGLRVVIDAASPLASSAAGPFVLVGVYGPEDTAAPVGSSLGTLLPIAALGGLLIGGGVAVMIVRWRSILVSIGFTPGGHSTSSTPTEDASITRSQVPESLSLSAPRRANGARGEPGSSVRGTSRRIPLRRIDRSSLDQGDDHLPHTASSAGNGAREHHGDQDDQAPATEHAQDLTDPAVNGHADPGADPHPGMGSEPEVVGEAGNGGPVDYQGATPTKPGKAGRKPPRRPTGKTKRKTSRTDRRQGRR
jgi:hypothetical protein